MITTFRRFIRKKTRGFAGRKARRTLGLLLVATGLSLFYVGGSVVCVAAGNADAEKNFANGKYVGKMNAAQFHENVRKDKIPIPILTYHSVHPNGEGHYTITPNNFEDQIRTLQSAGYHFIDPTELADYLLKDRPLPPKPLMITLDDGYKDNYTYAFPLLQKYGAKATIFIVGSYLERRPEFLTWGEVQEMAASGLVFFQNHTWNLHDHERNGSGKEVIGFIYQHEGESDQDYIKRLADDLKKDAHKITEVTGQKVISLAYPGGMSNLLTEAAAKEAGILLAFDGYNRVCNYRTHFNPYHMKRFNVESMWNGAKVLKVIEYRK